MTTFSKCKKLTALLLISVLSVSVLYPVAAAKPSQKESTKKKELYLPAKIERVPENNDFNNNDSEYSFQRMVESDNIAIFWNKEYGDDPMANPNETKRFDAHFALSECERIYNYYVDELKMVEKGHSLTDKYKMIVIVFGGDENTAFGGGEEDKIGMLWTPATRIHKTHMVH